MSTQFQREEIATAAWNDSAMSHKILIFIAGTTFHPRPTAATRETREGWPLRTIEIDVNGDSKSTNERGSFLSLVLWACRAGTRDFCSALAALAGQVHNISFLTVHFFNSVVPIAQQAGQPVACSVACLLVCVSGCHIVCVLEMC
jgi:hypothetical protein